MMGYISKFEKYKENDIAGRYVTLPMIEGVLMQNTIKGQLKVEGVSVLQKHIYSYQIGTGKTKLLLWSQMHGNESTTTKAVIDIIRFLNSDDPIAAVWLLHFTFLFVPMLNPDGAVLYTRENANQVDLNRDFLQLTQPESKLLMRLYESFHPDFCYNLHDQRTIFAVGNTVKPATVSFLAPAFNDARDLNDVRIKAIDVIVAINKGLQEMIPGQIGRFDDGFNRNCAGDTFQFLGTPTMLFEAGHYPGDYEREITRKYIFDALYLSFIAIYENVLAKSEITEYLNIPQNNPCFFDFVYRNVKINYDNSELITNFATQYREEILNDKVVFQTYIESVGDLSGFYGHQEIDAQGEMFQDEEGNFPIIGKEGNFYLGKNRKFVNSLLKK